IAVGSYAAAYLVSIAFRNRASWVRSWIWMSVAGALVFTVVLTLIGIRNWSDYSQRFPDAAASLGGYQALFIAGVFLFLFSALAGAIFLGTVRVILGLFDERVETYLR